MFFEQSTKDMTGHNASFSNYLFRENSSNIGNRLVKGLLRPLISETFIGDQTFVASLISGTQYFLRISARCTAGFRIE